ncbi:MAG: agl cluster protein AglQ [Algoriphagus sp.]|uniref:hypothetical protein n=1 Tax=Algoriphagus sp. TaxID=1872435 RepID=UPI0017C7C39E|nr:hypothetical protein [Algoriphagus sp.]NVJ86748.1 agl cluster protein AglQ [Algoriphagus sp.]
MNTEEVLFKSASAALSRQFLDGSMPAGHNGPYRDPETPVRNTSHWLISYLKSYELTGENKFKEAAEKSLSYLMSEKARPMKATFWHRKNPKKDFSNGLMGQAWTIEALEYAFRFFGDDAILRLAVDVFRLHPYKSAHKAWETVNVDGSIKGFDPTFNHQLWFAAVGGVLSKHGDQEIRTQVLDFINGLSDSMKTYSNGVIKHHPTGYQSVGKKEKLWAHYRHFRIPRKQKEYTYLKSIGYHGFNLYALGLIHNEFPELSFFETSLFKSMIAVIDSEEFKSKISYSPYSYDYNPPGFELAFALQKFGDRSKAELFLKEDFKRSYSEEKSQWGLKNPIDPETAAARVYELYQLSKMEIVIHD